MSLIRLRLTGFPQFGLLPRYRFAVRIQSQLQKRMLDVKKGDNSKEYPPRPCVLVLEPAPTFTFGRRQTEALLPEEEAVLRAPLRVQHSRVDAPPQGDAAGERRPLVREYEPDVDRSPRGGLTTFHGPGQLLFWPVIDLRSPLHEHLTVREYADVLEQTTIRALAEVTARWPTPIRGIVDSGNAGVWVRSRVKGAPTFCKIAALGVHLRRHVTGFGVAINLCPVISGPRLVNGWARIEPCGFDSAAVTSIEAELLAAHATSGPDERLMGTLRSLQANITRMWTREFARRLGYFQEDDRSGIQPKDVVYSRQLHWPEPAPKDQVRREVRRPGDGYYPTRIEIGPVGEPSAWGKLLGVGLEDYMPGKLVGVEGHPRQIPGVDLPRGFRFVAPRP